MIHRTRKNTQIKAMRTTAPPITPIMSGSDDVCCMIVGLVGVELEEECGVTLGGAVVLVINDTHVLLGYTDVLDTNVLGVLPVVDEDDDIGGGPALIVIYKISIVVIHTVIILTGMDCYQWNLIT